MEKGKIPWKKVGIIAIAIVAASYIFVALAFGSTTDKQTVDSLTKRYGELTLELKKLNNTDEPNQKTILQAAQVAYDKIVKSIKDANAEVDDINKQLKQLSAPVPLANAAVLENWKAPERTLTPTELEKFSKCVAKAETSGCTTGSALTKNNCHGIQIKGRRTKVTYNSFQESFDAFKNLWKKGYGNLYPTLGLAKIYTGNDKPNQWYNIVIDCMDEEIPQKIKR